MRAILIGPPGHLIPGRDPTHWVAVADYTPPGRLDDVPSGPSTKGLGEYSLVHAWEVANEEAACTHLPIVDLSGKPATARA